MSDPSPSVRPSQGSSGPHPIPVVRLIALDTQGRALLLRRADGHTGEGGWCLPGGKIDYGETAIEAAERELREETGLGCSDLTFLFYMDSPPVETGAMHCINFYFGCHARGDLVLDQESRDSAWIAPADLDRYEIVFRNDEGLRRYWSVE